MSIIKDVLAILSNPMQRTIAASIAMQEPELEQAVLDARLNLAKRQVKFTDQINKLPPNFKENFTTAVSKL